MSGRRSFFNQLPNMSETVFYKTFKRSATDWRQYSGGRKTTVATGLTYQQAKDACDSFNTARTPAQKRQGTMLEFTKQ